MALKVHHLNCGTLCPVSRALFNGRGGLVEPGELVCHCLLIETNEGLVLVDTGLGRDDIKRGFVNFAMDLIAPPRYDFHETAWDQVRQLGFSPRDVRHIILTHLDLDHAGGLSDFPEAKVHLHRQEYRSAQTGLIEGLRYLPRQWRHKVKWQTYEPLGENWFGFQAVRPLVGLPPEILLIPLPGHSKGHSGVAIQTEEGWLLHAGDAYFDRRQLDVPIPNCSPGLFLLQMLESSNHLLWAMNLRRLSFLANSRPDEVQMICSHDVGEYHRCLESQSLF